MLVALRATTTGVVAADGTQPAPAQPPTVRRLTLSLRLGLQRWQHEAKLASGFNGHVRDADNGRCPAWCRLRGTRGGYIGSVLGRSETRSEPVNAFCIVTVRLPAVLVA